MPPHDTIFIIKERDKVGKQSWWKSDFQVTSLLTGVFLYGMKERYKMNLPQIYPQPTYTRIKNPNNFFTKFPEFGYQHLKYPSNTDFYNDKSAVGIAK